MIGNPKQYEHDQGERNPDAEEHDQRFVGAVAGGDESLLELAHLRRRTRSHLADPLQRIDQHLLVAAFLDGLGAANLRQALLDLDGAGRAEGHRAGRNQQRDEDEPKEREQDDHITPRS